ncbi:MAG TPA: hypothetical protein VHX88_08715 [Solirubrobacteraceae bacterium]|jgi:hypothetical protein|nr:hypothetical protein [Solirubrobacteraceae bacterium]
MSRRIGFISICILGGAFALPPALADAHGRGSLSIAVDPDPLVAGDALNISGHLSGGRSAHRTVVVWRQPDGGAASVLGRTRTDASGDYQLAEADGTVEASTSFWAVAGRARSHTLDEPVQASMTLQLPALDVQVGAPLTVSGTVSPTVSGQQVELQQADQNATHGWRTIGRATVSGGSWSLSEQFATPGTLNLRALLHASHTLASSISNPVALVVQPVPDAQLSLLASTDSVQAGQPLALSGTTTTVPAGTAVKLLANPQGSPGGYSALASSTVAADGSFSFSVDPTANTAYVVQTAGVRSAPVEVGVAPRVILTSSANTGTVGESLTFNGSVAPPLGGQEVDLQVLSDDGTYHTVERGEIGASGTFSLVHILAGAGQRTFQVLVPGGVSEEQGVSNPVVVSVSPSGAN